MKKKTAGCKATTEQQTDLYQQVTDKIIIALENGVPPWRRPWRSAQKVYGSGLPVNAVTGRYYSGVNVPLLWMAAEEAGYGADRWLTYQQAKVAGGQVRKGEQSAMAIIFKPFEKQLRDGNDSPVFRDGVPVMEKLAMMKPLQLFNVAQCEGLPDKVYAPTVKQPESDAEGFSTEQQQQVLEILNATGVKCSSHRQNRAYYSPGADRIVLPATSQFRSPEDYWSTLLHELVHATGHRSRLDREGITSSTREFGDPVYAFEELIAETGSAFLCAHLGIFGEVQHESYLNGWLSVLRNDKKAFFRACRLAREASEYLLKPPGETHIEAA